LKFTLLFDILEHQLQEFADNSKEYQDKCDATLKEIFADSNQKTTLLSQYNLDISVSCLDSLSSGTG
jgi:hypothetical protein